MSVVLDISIALQIHSPPFSTLLYLGAIDHHGPYKQIFFVLWLPVVLSQWEIKKKKKKRKLQVRRHKSFPGSLTAIPQVDDSSCFPLLKFRSEGRKWRPQLPVMKHFSMVTARTKAFSGSSYPFPFLASSHVVVVMALCYCLPQDPLPSLTSILQSPL